MLVEIDLVRGVQAAALVPGHLACGGLGGGSGLVLMATSNKCYFDHFHEFSSGGAVVLVNLSPELVVPNSWGTGWRLLVACCGRGLQEAIR